MFRQPSSSIEKGRLVWRFAACLGVWFAAWPVPARADEILNWNHIAQQAVLDTATDGVRQDRALAIMHLAQFEALNSIEPGHYADYSKFGGPLPNAAGADQTAAAAQAAHDVLVSLYPTQQSNFDAALANSLAGVANGSAKTAGIALGSASASRMLNLRANDHYGDTVPYTPTNNPGNWQPTGTAQKPAAFTQMPLVTPFALLSGNQFRGLLQGPPALNSQAFADAINQIKDLGSINSTTRTQDQSNIAKFWYLAGGTTNQTSGLWNRIAQTVLQTHPHDMLDESKLFSLLNVGQFDALITSFDSKYQYNFWRPETAIHLANATGEPNSYTNPGIVGDPTWTPFLAAPNFPSYVSNHAAVDGAAEEILKDFFGSDNISFTASTQGFSVPDRSFTSFSQAAEEGAISRIYAGIHYSFDKTDGLALGQADQQYIDIHELGAFPEPVSGTLLLTAGIVLTRRRRGGFRPIAGNSTVEELEQRTLLSNTFTVTNLNDSGPGSLRQAIASANGGAATGADPIVTWNAIALQAAVDGKTGFIEMRDDAMVHLAQYDAVDSIEQRYAEYSKYSSFLPNAAGADETAAANQAAHDVLSSVVPVDQTKYDAALATALAAIPDGPAKTAGIALGNAAAARVLALRANDHAFDVVPYTPGTAPGNWRPTTNGLAAQNTQWPLITPFTMQSGSQFRSTLPGPPPLDSKAFADAVNEVIDLGSPNSTTRTADQSNIAKFWFVLVPRLWNVAAAQVEQSHPLNLLDSARLFALLNIASADDAIASNDSKYFFNFWRPETAIRLANSTGLSNSYSNPLIQGDPNWLPFLPTPAFPSYVSNHASLDGAAAAVMQNVFGTDNISFSLPNTSAFAGVPARSFTSFSQAAVEGALSRIYAGIHYPFDSTDGLLLGQEVGSYVDAHEFSPIQATISFAPRLHGTIGLTSGPLVVTGDVAINGPGAYRLTVSGTDSSGVFTNLGPHGEMDISGLAIADGSAASGGGIDNQGGTASLTNVVVFGNRAVGSSSGDARGGGLYNGAGGTLTVTNSLVLGNQARGASGGGNAAGGGIYNLGTLSVSNTLFLGNLALGGSGADNAAGGWGQGGGLANGAGGTGTFSNVLIDRNAAVGGEGGEGGAGGNGLGGGIADAGTLSVTNTIVSNNSAIGGDGDEGGGGNGLGGGIYIGSGGAVTLSSAIITRNRAEEGEGDQASDGSGIGGGIYNLGTLSIDMASVIRKNRASTTADDVFGG